MESGNSNNSQLGMKRMHPALGRMISFSQSFSLIDAVIIVSLTQLHPLCINWLTLCLFRKWIRLIMYEFDKIDVKIVNLLLDDGRMPASEIARRIGDISERAVRYRIDRMIHDEIVRVSAVAKPQAFGLT